MLCFYTKLAFELPVFGFLYLGFLVCVNASLPLCRVSPLFRNWWLKFQRCNFNLITKALKKSSYSFDFPLPTHCYQKLFACEPAIMGPNGML